MLQFSDTPRRPGAEMSAAYDLHFQCAHVHYRDEVGVVTDAGTRLYSFGGNDAVKGSKNLSLAQCSARRIDLRNEALERATATSLFAFSSFSRDMAALAASCVALASDCMASDSSASATPRSLYRCSIADVLARLPAYPAYRIDDASGSSSMTLWCR
jgi:hypothetical protein